MEGGSNYRPRKVTAILYINNIEWKREYGGCLRIYLRQPLNSNHCIINNNDNNLEINDCKKENEEEFIDIEPIAGRLVIFLSGAMDHEVLPVGDVPRLAITTWYH